MSAQSSQTSAERQKPQGRAIGRPSSFNPAYCEQVEKLCKLGATDEQIAEFFDVAVATIYNWKNKHPEFVEAIKNGKVIADMQVSNSLFRRAVGYEMPDTGKHVSPDVTAQIFWLKNRQPEYWRDRIEQQVNHTLTLPQAFEDYIRAVNTERDAKVINGAVAEEGQRVGKLPAPVRS